MTKTKWLAAGIVVLLGASGAYAQSANATQSGTSSTSLGDAARAARKSKPKSDTSRHFDNDNLPVNEQLSVVGPDPSTATSGDQKIAQNGTADQKAAADEKQKNADELQQKIADQKAKIDGMNHELDLDQREYRLRAAAFYGDAGAQLRNAAQWSKDDTQYKADIDQKQKAIAAAQQELTDLQEQARKAGIKSKDSDSDKDKNK
jgi:hypothetical protein